MFSKPEFSKSRAGGVVKGNEGQPRLAIFTQAIHAHVAAQHRAGQGGRLRRNLGLRLLRPLALLWGPHALRTVCAARPQARGSAAVLRKQGFGQCQVPLTLRATEIMW